MAVFVLAIVQPVNVSIKDTDGAKILFEAAATRSSTRKRLLAVNFVLMFTNVCNNVDRYLLSIILHACSFIGGILVANLFFRLFF